MTWRKILDYCIGEVGLKPDEFWSMTFAEVDLACKGYEMRMQRSQELPRIMATILYNSNRGKNPAKGVTEIYPLPMIDKRHTKGELMTKEEFDEAKEFSKKATWQSNGLKQN